MRFSFLLGSLLLRGRHAPPAAMLGLLVACPVLLLGACGGVLIADYFIIRRCRLDLAGLYRREGPYWYVGGYNPVALIALAAGIAPCLPGFAAVVGLLPDLPTIWWRLYDYAWFVSFGIALLTYTLLMSVCYPRTGAAE